MDKLENDANIAIAVLKLLAEVTVRIMLGRHICLTRNCEFVQFLGKQGRVPGLEGSGGGGLIRILSDWDERIGQK